MHAPHPHALRAFTLGFIPGVALTYAYIPDISVIPFCLAGVISVAISSRHGVPQLPWRASLIGLFYAVLISAATLHTRPNDPLEHVDEVQIVSAPAKSSAGWRVRTRCLKTSRDVLLYADTARPPGLPGELLRVDQPVRAFSKTPGPHLFDRAALMRARGVEGSVYLREPPAHIGARNDPLHRAWRWLAQRKLNTSEHLHAKLPSADAALVEAMLLGERGELLPSTTEPFAVTGTAHLLAISGLHLGGLAMILLLLGRALASANLRTFARHGPMRFSAPLVAIALSLYVVMIGGPLSARRALLMVCIALGLHISRSRSDPLNALCATLLVLLTLAPGQIMEPGLWLSASATFAILRYAATSPADASERIGARLLASCRATVSVSVAAWAGTLPALLALTHEISLVSVGLNALFVPLVSLLIFPMLLLGLTASLLGVDAGVVSMLWGTSMLETARVIAESASLHELASYRPGGPSSALLLAITATVFCGFCVLETPRRAATAALFAAILIASPARWRGEQGVLRVDFIPVGQGDATLITFPDDSTMLIDAGGSTSGRDPGASKTLPLLRYRGLHRIDDVVLTHPDVDHMRGLFAVFRRVHVTRFIRTPDPESHELAHLDSFASWRGAHVISMAPEATRTFVRAGVQVTLRAPPLATDKNNRSIVVELEHHGVRVLLPGDIEREAEAWLVQQSPKPAHIVKMPHHGSRTSSTPEFIAHTSPTLAVASAGLNNRYGHPHDDVTRRYRRAGASTWRTDRDGLISVLIYPSGLIEVLTAR